MSRLSFLLFRGRGQAIDSQAATTPTHPLEWVKAKGRSDSLARLARDERHLRSKNRRSDLQFTLRLSQLAAFFIDARAERFTVQSLSRVSTVYKVRYQWECTTIHTAIDDDPSAGSPTETLLRLLLPLNDQVRPAFPTPNNSVESKGLTKPFDR